MTASDKSGFRVWWDNKRMCFSTDIAFKIAQRTGLSPLKVAHILLPYIKAELAKADLAHPDHPE